MLQYLLHRYVAASVNVEHIKRELDEEFVSHGAVVVQADEELRELELFVALPSTLNVHDIERTLCLLQERTEKRDERRETVITYDKRFYDVFGCTKEYIHYTMFIIISLCVEYILLQMDVLSDFPSNHAAGYCWRRVAWFYLRMS